MTERQAFAKARKLARENKCDYVIYEDMDDYTDQWTWFICRESVFERPYPIHYRRAYEVDRAGYIF